MNCETDKLEDCGGSLRGKKRTLGTLEGGEENLLPQRVVHCSKAIGYRSHGGGVERRMANTNGAH